MELLEYFNNNALPQTLSLMMSDLKIDPGVKEKLIAFAEPLRLKNKTTEFHYLHSMRVAVISTLTAAMLHLDPKPAFYAGTLHDIGKILMPESLLAKETEWTDRDAKMMSRHVMYSYDMIADVFGFTASIILWHHRFQNRSYPKKLPNNMREFHPAAEILIPVYGMILAIADVYDAMHRVDSHGKLTGDEIKERMLSLRPEWQGIVQAMYDKKILTTKIVGVDNSFWFPPSLSEFTSEELK